MRRRRSTRYMTKTTDPFGLGNTLRQFEEIWEIDDAQDPGTPLVTALRAKLIAMENGSCVCRPVTSAPP